MKKLLFLLLSCITIICVADLQNVQTIGQKNRNQAVGQGLQVTDTLCLLSVASHSPDSTQLGIDSSGNVIATDCECIHKFRDSISSTQILNSAVTYIQLIASPPTGYYIKLLYVDEFYHYGGTAYSGSGDCLITYANANNALLLDGNILAATASVNSPFQPFLPGSYSSTVSAPLLNAPVYFGTAGSNPTTGTGYLIIHGDYVLQKY